MVWYWWIILASFGCYLSVGIVYIIVRGEGAAIMCLLSVDPEPLSLPNPTLGEIVIRTIAFVVLFIMAVVIWPTFKGYKVVSEPE